ncbi:hypothetical protein ANCDUO_09300 [Ancylostoma duodenale]|uniref:Uncharacterized protein n=1 Tax=Ancylostoma duodenale TaxID=51022 RepID=A0A0C2DDE0_9BILA|nr:hypothetical protein ANCDUO_09300 [Ancylostoma duodenale]
MVSYAWRAEVVLEIKANRVGHLWFHLLSDRNYFKEPYDYRTDSAQYVFLFSMGERILADCLCNA